MIFRIASLLGTFRNEFHVECFCYSITSDWATTSGGVWRRPHSISGTMLQSSIFRKEFWRRLLCASSGQPNASLVRSSSNRNTKVGSRFHQLVGFSKLHDIPLKSLWNGWWSCPWRVSSKEVGIWWKWQPTKNGIPSNLIPCQAAAWCRHRTLACPLKSNIIRKSKPA